MKNLRDKLNSIPQDLDQEKLWNKIQSNKKKKRRFIWIWFLPLFLIGTILMIKPDMSLNTYSYNPIVATTQTTNSNLLPKKVTVDKNEATYLQNKTTTNIEANESTTLSQIVKNEIKQIDNISKKTKDKSSINKIGSTTHSFNTDRFVTDNNNSYSKDLSQKTNTLPINSYLKKNLSITKPKQKEKNTIEIGFPPLESLSFIPLRQQGDLVSKSIEPFLVERAKYDLPFYIRLEGGYGRDLHKFKNTNRENEKELESLTASIELEQYLTRRFSISGRLVYTRNTTNLTFENQQSSVALIDGSLINDVYVTTYNLYNNYSRFDAVLNMKYALELRKFIISPTVGFGYNLSSHVNGETSQDEGEIIQLASLGYKKSGATFGEIKMDIGYELNNKMILGLTGSMQSNRSLDIKNTHSISPSYLSIFIKKTIK